MGLSLILMWVLVLVEWFGCNFMTCQIGLWEWEERKGRRRWEENEEGDEKKTWEKEEEEEVPESVWLGEWVGREQKIKKT